MKTQEKILGIIPARGGSKAIPHKNIQLLASKPLIALTIETAKKVKAIDRLIVSTDSPKIAQIAKKYGAETPFLRPKQLSDDHSPVILAFQHALNWLKEKQNYQPSAVLCLQATSPFRSAEQISQAIKIFLADPQADCLVSVQSVPHNFLPNKLMRLKGKYLKADILSQKQKTTNFNRQNLQKLYARNGPSILLTKTELILKGKFYGQKILPFVMNDFASNLDIDSPADLALARRIVKTKK